MVTFGSAVAGSPDVDGAQSIPTLTNAQLILNLNELKFLKININFL
jgi:hypothetical protein